MRPSHQQGNDFLAHRPITGVGLQHNDAVNIVGGEHQGKAGSIVSLEDIGPYPIYLVELDSGFDVSVAENHLQFVAHQCDDAY